MASARKWPQLPRLPVTVARYFRVCPRHLMRNWCVRRLFHGDAPQIMPPSNWLRTQLGIDNAAAARRRRPGDANLTEIGLTLTSAKTAPSACIAYSASPAAAGAAGIELRKASARGYRRSFAQGVIVATEQAAVAGDHAGIAGAE